MKDSFLKRYEIKKIGFKKVGTKVKISKFAHFYNPHDIVIGNNVRIDDFCILSGKIHIGDNVHVAAYSALYGGESGIIINNYVNISSRVSIYAINDDYSGKSLSIPVIPNKYKTVNTSPVLIKDFVIIGSSSIVLPGIILEEGSAFGCFSLIKENTQPWYIYAGIPIKKGKKRSKQLISLSRKYESDNK